MKRIGSMGASLLLVGLLVAVLAAPTWAAYKAEYKMSVRTTQTSPWGAGAQKFADIVREKSGGQINIKVYFNGALFSILLPIFSDNQTARIWCFAFLLVALALVYVMKRGLFEKLALAVLLLLLCSPVAHPWYMGWLIVLLPLAPLSSGLALAATASLSSITFVSYQLLGIWKDYPLVLFLEFVPVVILLWFDLRRNHRTAVQNPE